MEDPTAKVVNWIFAELVIHSETACLALTEVFLILMIKGQADAFHAWIQIAKVAKI